MASQDGPGSSGRSWKPRTILEAQDGPELPGPSWFPRTVVASQDGPDGLAFQSTLYHIVPGLGHFLTRPLTILVAHGFISIAFHRPVESDGITHSRGHPSPICASDMCCRRQISFAGGANLSTCESALLHACVSCLLRKICCSGRSSRVAVVSFYDISYLTSYATFLTSYATFFVYAKRLYLKHFPFVPFVMRLCVTSICFSYCCTPLPPITPGMPKQELQELRMLIYSSQLHLEHEEEVAH